VISGPDHYIDRNGVPVLVRSEPCKDCGRDSDGIHPAGVVPGRWLCSCGRRQDDLSAEYLDGID
jgi:hypothetical protein